MLDLFADATRIAMAFSALVFCLICVAYDKPRFLALVSLMIAVPAVHFAVFSSGAAQLFASVINLGVTGLLAWLVARDPRIGIAEALRGDNWVQKARR